MLFVLTTGRKVVWILTRNTVISKKEYCGNVTEMCRVWASESYEFFIYLEVQEIVCSLGAVRINGISSEDTNQAVISSKVNILI